MSGIVTAVDAFEITLPLPQPLRLGEIDIPNREYTVVRVYDDNGRFGTAYGLSRGAPVSLTVRRTVAPHWVGRPLDAHADLYSHTVRANVCLGTNGVFWRGLSLLDCALYDLLAARAGVPLCVYLGGRPRQVPTALVGGYPSPDETDASLADQMRAMAAQQPAVLKIASSSDHARDTHRLRVCRAAVPAGPPLAIDLHWNGGDAPTLLAQAALWTDLHMAWVEDPFGFDDFENIAALADALSYPVAVGDEQSGVRHFRHLIDLGRIDIVRMDPTVCGGVRAFVEIAAYAASRGLSVSCHGSPYLNSQLASAVDNVGWIEHLPEALEPTPALFQGDLDWEPGGFLTSDRPGVGYVWDEAALAAHRNMERP